VYNDEIGKLSSEPDRMKREKIASSRAWLKLLGDAKKHLAKFTHAQGNEVVLAVIREKQFDKNGNTIVIVDGQDASDPFVMRKKTYVFARAIARRITHENQDVTIVIVGSKGKGKSWFALALAEAIARELSMIFYKNEDHWREFWDYKEDTAIIDDDKILALLQKKTKKHHIKLLDDVGYSKGIDSRKWQSKENDEATSTVSINRTENGVAIYTSQSHMFIDKKIRLLLTYYMEMTGPKNDDNGTNMAQLHEITLHPRDTDDPAYYPFIYRTWKEGEDEHVLMHPIIVGGCSSLEVIEWYEPQRAIEAENAIMKKRKTENADDHADIPESISTDEMLSKLLNEHPEWKSQQYADELGITLKGLYCKPSWLKRNKSTKTPLTATTTS
jgi:hypothetical protein